MEIEERKDIKEEIIKMLNSIENLNRLKSIYIITKKVYIKTKQDRV